MNAVHEFGNSITKRLPKGETKTVAQQNLGNKTNSQRFHFNVENDSWVDS